MSGNPNYIYVRVKNRTTASTGAERLLVYWASASTGLAWDPTKAGGSFIDNVQNNVAFGMEITKVRKNAATASQTERDAYLAALRKIATDPAFKIPNGQSYWTLQQEIHRFGPTYRHGAMNQDQTVFIPSVAFLPWHREFINRYEGMLQEADPTVKLLYWNWTQHTTNAPLDYSNNFMGNFGLGNPPSAVPVGGPISADTDPIYPNVVNGLSVVTRRREMNFNVAREADSTIINRVPFDAPSNTVGLAGRMESISHNNSHAYIASFPTANNDATAGDQLFQNYAARDPFFFFLHTKVDELWARWQRKNLTNLDPASTFGTASNNPVITGDMGPWDGNEVQDGLPDDVPSTGLEPWTPSGGHLYAKPADDPSVTTPPYYDSSPLTIPAMQPGEEVIIQIPWYPPSPAKFGNINDPAHVCIIARIETNALTPFGMTTPETADINFNTQQNNNIAWKNVSVVDSFPGPFKLMKFWLADDFKAPVLAGLRFGAMLNQGGAAFFERGTVRVDLGRELFERWRRAGGRAVGIEAIGDGRLRITRPEAALEGIPLRPGDRFPVRLFFELNRDYRPTRPGEAITFDVVQTGLPGNDRGIVGGQRYAVALDKLKPVERGRVWRWLPADRVRSNDWKDRDFDDGRWNERKLDLGWVEPAPKDGMKGHEPTASTYLFRRTFEVEDPAFFRDLSMLIKRSDGAIVYLNGKEVYRFNLPDGRVSRETAAPRPLRPIEREAYFPVKLDPDLLREGTNVIAVEIHRGAGNRGPLTFDAELIANAESSAQAPVARFANVANGTLLRAGTVARIEVDALKPDGAVRSATLSVNGRPVQALSSAPFRFALPVKAGKNRMSVSVTGDDGTRSLTHATVNGVRNVPPTVRLSVPDQMRVDRGQTVTVVAQASDPDGKIARVDFHAQESHKFGAPSRFLGSVTRAPYTVRVSDFQSDHATIVAVAYDSEGARTASIPVMILVNGGKPK